MTTRLVHRGPDGEGFHCAENLALGHRRLAIIDLDLGIQPMFSDDMSIALVLNGEIYNYIEIRDELIKLGHRFKTQSDTEVVIRAYQQWGVDCHEKFNGMWAFALWDGPDQRLIVSRDRLGEKPLFHAIYDNTFIFGSEIKSLLAYGIPVEPNTEMLKIYLSLGYVPAPFSYFKNIHKLAPGHFLIVSDQVSVHKYWDLPDITEKDMITNKAEVYTTFRELLEDSVRLRMRSDVPFGAMLSGGLDSSTLVGMMAGVSKNPVETFTVGYKEKAYDERKLAAMVAAAYGCNYNELLVSAELLEAMYSKVLKHFDEPFGDSSAVASGLISSLASQKVKMVLTGDGGDEVLSGYTMYQGEKFAQLYGHVPDLIHKGNLGMAELLKRLSGKKQTIKWDRITEVLKSSKTDFLTRVISKASWSDSGIINALLPDHQKYYEVRDFFADFYRNNRFTNTMYKLMWYNFKLSLPNDMLTKVDRMSMAFSIEARLPFLDHRLVEFMYGVDMKIKMEGFERKSVLRKTMDHKMPSSILHAAKKGFALPLKDWYKHSILHNQVMKLENAGWIGNPSVMRKILDDNASSRKDYGNLLFLLSIYNFWLEKHNLTAG